MPRHPLKREIIATHVVNSMVNRVGSTLVHRLAETTGARPHEVVRAYLQCREVFGLVPLWMAIEALDNDVDDQVQSAMLISTSGQLERGTAWFLRYRRPGEDIAGTIARFRPGVEALAARLPQLVDPDERNRVDAEVARLAAAGVPGSLARDVATFDTLHAANPWMPWPPSTSRRATASACRDCAKGSARCRATSIGASWPRAPCRTTCRPCCVP
jgi:glutamate dehydrogenase